MLIPYDKLVSKYNIQPTGIIHVGANNGAECKTYYDNGVTKTIWFEPIPKVFEQLIKNTSIYPNVLCFNELINEKEIEFTLNISDNNGESSSIFDFGEHKEMHSNVHFNGIIRLKAKRLDNILNDITGYDFINLDIQGAELSALKSLGTLINQINFVYCEVNRTEVYKKIPLFDEVNEWLEGNGFEFKEAVWVKNNKGQDAWGDGFWIRKNI